MSHKFLIQPSRIAAHHFPQINGLAPGPSFTQREVDTSLIQFDPRRPGNANTFHMSEVLRSGVVSMALSSGHWIGFDVLTSGLRFLLRSEVVNIFEQRSCN